MFSSNKCWKGQPIYENVGDCDIMESDREEEDLDESVEGKEWELLGELWLPWSHLLDHLPTYQLLQLMHLKNSFSF